MNTRKVLIPFANVEIRNERNMLLGILTRQVFTDKKGKYFFPDISQKGIRYYFTDRDKNIKEINFEICYEIVD